MTTCLSGDPANPWWIDTTRRIHTHMMLLRSLPPWLLHLLSIAKDGHEVPVIDALRKCAVKCLVKRPLRYPHPCLSSPFNISGLCLPSKNTYFKDHSNPLGTNHLNFCNSPYLRILLFCCSYSCTPSGYMDINRN